MAVRELDPSEKVFPIQVRELLPDEEVFPDTRDPSDPFAGQEVRNIRPALERFGRSANVGISEGLGGPVDLMTGLMNLASREGTRFVNIFRDPSGQTPERRFEAPQISGALGSSDQIRSGFAALGLAPAVGEEDPDSLAGSVGRISGASAAFLLPTGAAANTARGVATGVRAAPKSVAGRVVQDIGKSVIETPGRFVAAEAAGVAGAGTGGFIAREKFPDSPAASFIGEILGGLSPAGAVTAVKVLPTVVGIRLARAIVRPVTKTGGQRRAEQRVQTAARDPESAAAELAAPETIPGLTPAQQTGDEGLLSLERAVIESSEQLIGKSDEQIAQVTASIRTAVSDIGEGVPIEKTAATLQEARQYVQSLMDARMRIAALKADERIAALGPNATREQANIIAREEIEAAREAVNKQVRELWNAVPESVVLPTNKSTEAYKELLATTPRAKRHNIPDIARRFLDPESNEKFAATETVAELQGLRSQLLEDATIARAAGKSNEERMANDLADAVLDDLGAQRDAIKGEAGDALRAALDATADMKARFDKGTVGDIRAFDRRGAPTTPKALTLETAVGQGGPRARVETRAITEAVETPALRGAVEDFLLDDFQRRAVRDGVMDSKKAEAFLARQKDVLEDFPELRSRIETAIEANDVSALRTGQAEGLAKRLNDPKVSRAAIFLKEPVEGAMERIAKSPKPERTMRELMKQARRDPTGDALKGLKTGFGDLLLGRVSTRTETSGGDFLVSGRLLKRLLNEGPVSKMAKTLLSPDEQKRLTEIADVAEKVGKATSAKVKPEGIINDNPSLLFSTMARILGAQLGRQVAQATGGGTVQTPGIMAGLFQRAITAGTQDPARRLLIDAMGDKKLFEAMLSNGVTPAERKFVRAQVNAWLLSIGAEQIQDDEK